jgi:pseudouridine synthase
MGLLLSAALVLSVGLHHERAWAGYGTHRVFALHKPTGVTTEHGTPATGGAAVGRKAVLNDWVAAAETLMPDSAAHGRITAMGRLDKETSGLILLTADGKLTELVLRPGGLKKTYIATVKLRQPHVLREEEQFAHLLRGVQLGDGIARADEVQLLDRWKIDAPEPQALRYGKPKQRKRAAAAAAFSSGGSDENRALATTVAEEAAASDEAAAEATRTRAASGNIPGSNVYAIRIVVRIGRNRVVRRMMAAAGLPVYALHREEIGPLRLEELSIPTPGDLVALDDEQETLLREACAPNEYASRAANDVAQAVARLSSLYS